MTTSREAKFIRITFLLTIGLSLFCCGIPSADAATCPLPWNINATLPNRIDLTKKCPYGTRIQFFDVTVPKTDHLRLELKLCVFWGLVPFLVMGFAILDTAWKAVALCGLGTREMSFICFIIWMTLINEVVLKAFVQEKRPDHSCNYSCGMPSGHSVFAFGFFTLMFLDAIFRVTTRVPRDLASAEMHAKAVIKSRRKTFLGYTAREWMVGDFRALVSIIPLTSAHSISQLDFVYFVFFWGIVLLPVPFSRVVLEDHTSKQVIVGSTIGFVEAIVYFVIVRHAILPWMNKYLGERIGCIFVHDFPLPVHEAVSKIFFLLVAARSDEDPDMAHKALKELGWAYHELSWYIKDIGSSIDGCSAGWANFDEDKVVVYREMERLKAVRQEVLMTLTAGMPGWKPLAKNEDELADMASFSSWGGTTSSEEDLE